MTAFSFGRYYIECQVAEFEVESDDEREVEKPVSISDDMGT